MPWRLAPDDNLRKRRAPRNDYDDPSSLIVGHVSRHLHLKVWRRKCQATTIIVLKQLAKRTKYP